jgi:hypothetical protein
MTSLGRQIAEMLPAESSALRRYVMRVWGDYYHPDTRGLREWIQAVELRDPALRWHREERGADRVVWVEVDAPCPLGDVGCGLWQACGILRAIVRRHWGADPHRYHWCHSGAKRRYSRERQALERVFEAAVEDVWLPLAGSAIFQAMRTPLWRVGDPTRYHSGPLSDDEIARGGWAPISPAAHKQVDEWRQRLSVALGRLYTQILRLTPEDLYDYAHAAGCTVTTLGVTPVLLARVAHWVRRGRPTPPPVVMEEVPGLWDVLKADVGIQTHCARLRADVDDAQSSSI